MSAAVQAAQAKGRPGDPGDRSSAGTWFFQFLLRELQPYPGRASVVTRIVASTTLAMLVLMTFHITGGALGAFFALTIPRDNLRNTVQQTFVTIAVFCLATVYVLVGVALFLDSPVTHFLWVTGSLYLVFFVVGTARNYGAAAGFSFLIATAIPIWDREGDTNVKVALTLAILLSIVIGTLSTVLVESAYRTFSTADPIVTGISDRLRVAGLMLRSLSRGQSLAPSVEAKLLQYAMIGPSSLRQQLIRAEQTPGVRARASAAIAMSVRVVELCAVALGQTATIPLDAGASERLSKVAEAVNEQSTRIAALPNITCVGSSTLPRWTGSEAPSHTLPVLPEIERTISLLSDIANSFGLPKQQQDARQNDGARGRAGSVARMLSLSPAAILNAAFVPDAWTNPAHLVFALRGWLAATLCYLIYNGVDWPGINTSVATCIITALGTVGSSRQKQLLRITGAFVGGFVISLPAQVYLLPFLDSIVGFTVFFSVVMTIAAWFSTASPRLSYFGWQIALAFYLINLQEPFEQISLSVARDRVIGILLGLVAMWIVFDRIAAPRAIERMDALLRATLHMLGELASAVAQGEGVARVGQLRESINDLFSQLNAQADAVPFEYGRRRDRELRQRERMQNMQPTMRSLFLLVISLWETDLLPGPDRISSAEAFSKTQSQGRAVQGILQKLAEALHSLAVLPEPQAGASHLDLEARADAAVGAVEQELNMMRNGWEQGQGTPLSLCTGLVASLQALQRASSSS